MSPVVAHTRGRQLRGVLGGDDIPSYLYTRPHGLVGWGARSSRKQPLDSEFARNRTVRQLADATESRRRRDVAKSACLSGRGMSLAESTSPAQSGVQVCWYNSGEESLRWYPALMGGFVSERLGLRQWRPPFPQAIHGLLVCMRYLCIFLFGGRRRPSPLETPQWLRGAGWRPR